MVDLDVLVVVGLGCGSLAADDALKRPLSGMRSPMLLQVVAAMEDLAAVIALVLFRLLVFTRVPQPIVFPGELQAAVVASIRLYRLVRVDVRGVIGLAHERLRAHCAPERFAAATGVHPLVLFEVPLGSEPLVADRAREFQSAVRLGVRVVRGHV